MKEELTLAKAITVDGKSSLPSNFAKYYIDDVDMYLFFSETHYNPMTASYSGKFMLHDQLISKYNLQGQASKHKINYVSVEMKPDRRHTYLISNRRCCPLSMKQKRYLKRLFEVDS